MNSCRFATVLLGLAGLSGFGFSAGFGRQAPAPIGYGQTARNLINFRHHSWAYVFDARRGDLVTIAANTVEGDLDPYVHLQDFYGNTLAEDDDSGAGLNARLEYGVRQDGRYLIVVTRYQGERAPSAGVFELSLDGVPNGVLGLPPEGHELLRYGVGASNNIHAEQSGVRYAFAGWRGDIISLGVSRRAGAFTPKVEVYLPGSARSFLDLTADANGRISVEGVVLPRTGYYTIRIGAAPTDAPGASGGYQITLQGFLGEQPERQERVRLIELMFGESYQGDISDEMPERYYAFDGFEGQFMRATMTVTAGNPAPLLILLDEDGDEVAFGDTPLQAEIEQVRLPRTGRYTLVAGRAGGATAAGSFALTARLLSGDEIALERGALSITLRWDNAADLDLIVRDPAGDRLSRENREVAGGGLLDVDANAGCESTIPQPVEHAYWPGPAPPGIYEVIVWNRRACGATGPAAFELVVEADGAEVKRTHGELLLAEQYRTIFQR